MRYHSWSITFNEIPKEVSLVFSITGCGGPCKGCHSPFLFNPNNGTLLTDEFYLETLTKYLNQATTVLFLGGEWYEERLHKLLKLAKRMGYKTALYSCREYEEIPRVLKYNLNYLKVGPYIEGRGGLESVFTNQKFYQLKPKKKDLTDLFWPQSKPK